MMVRAARSFTPGPYFWNQKVNRSETQYKWTRNCALIFSYRSPVAVVPIGISGVGAG